MLNNRIFLYALTIIFSIGLTFASTGFAASCKGLSQNKCESASDCTWVKSYKTKTGKTVSAYCRAKSGKSSSSSKSTKSSSSSSTSSSSSKDSKKQ